MPSITHRLTIDAPPAHVLDLAATKQGIERWWTSRPVTGDDRAGGRFAVSFGDSDAPAAVFEVLERSPLKLVWHCVEGPAEWQGTRVTFTVRPRADGGTTLSFGHRGWREETEFMGGCSTNWAAYLMSLKSGAEGRGFTPFPGGEVSRWD